MQIDAVHIGPPKSASTWLYRCLQKHNEVGLCEVEESRFFTTHQRKKHSFDTNKDLIMDFDTAYLCDPLAPERMYEHNSDMDILVTLRDPIERAFSHYWHDKRKTGHDRSFSEVLENHGLYRLWIGPSLYAYHLERYLEHFPKEKIHIFWFSDLLDDNTTFLHDVQDTLGISRNTPKLVGQKINKASVKQNVFTDLIAKMGRILEKVGSYEFILWLKRREIDQKVKQIFSNKDEYERGLDEDIRKAIQYTLSEQIDSLEELTGKSLESWRT